MQSRTTGTPVTPTSLNLASYMEHTLLKAEATPSQIDALCDEAVEHGFVGVCVQPCYVHRAVQRLEIAQIGSDARFVPLVISVTGFPLGGSRSDTKADEARRALDDGAQEIDMVAPIGALLAGDYEAVRSDILAVAQVVHGRHGILKVILETAALSNERIILGCRLSAEGEADFVKTSTGFHPAGGATVEHVRLLYRHAAPMRVKAAGGIRSADVAAAMIEAGAARIGASASVAILDSWKGRHA